MSNIIENLTITKDTKHFNLPQMGASDYQAIKGILARLDIEWDRKRGMHVLSKSSYSKWNTYVNTGKLPKLNPTAFFPTPIEVIELMFGNFFDTSYVEYLKEYQPKSLRVLEPSAGVGAIAKFARKYFGESLATIDTVEYLPENCEALEKEGFTPFCGDFLDYTTAELYDVVLMNPPFSLVGDKYAYMTHVMHALSLLKPDGKLVAILPTGWLIQSNKRIDAFKEIVALHSSWDFNQIINSGAFKSSGTMIETMCICLEKNTPMNKEKVHCGWDTPAMWSFNLHSDALMTGCQKACDLYARAQSATSLKQAKEAYRSFFEYAKSELATQAMFYTQSTCQRVINRIVSYEFSENSDKDTQEIKNAHIDSVSIERDNGLPENEFELTSSLFTNKNDMHMKTKKRALSSKPKKTAQPKKDNETLEIQCEFCW